MINSNACKCLYRTDLTAPSE